jgi:eukaryotic-like serine/threonine-protein kinase
MPLTAGTWLGPYEILGSLGAGGMGEVYRARDAKLNRDVALKILPDAFATDADRLTRFRREAQVLASLNHPNIAQIYGFEDSGVTHALVLELVEGPTLADRILEGPMPLAEAVPIAKQIAEALAAAHEHGIVHRDLKPANVKVRDDGTAKVLDFGIAKAVDPAPSSSVTESPTLTARATELGVILGTAAYMSPEQAKGKAIDKRVDIWAFGCVVYEMLTGKRPFKGEDISDTLASVLRDDPDWTALPASVPPSIRALLEGCLKKDRRERFGDISTPLFLLNQPQNATSGVTPVPTVAPGSPTRRWEHVVPLLATGLGGAALAGIVAMMVWPSMPTSSVTRFQIVLGEKQAFTHMGRQAVAISRDGMRIAYTANVRLNVREMSDLEPRVIPGVEDATGLTSPVFSPDGHSIAFYSISDRTIKRISLGGGPPQPICTAENPYGMSWAGDEILYGQGEQGIWRVTASGGDKPELLVKVESSQLAHGPQRLPGGDAVLFTLAPATGSNTNWDEAQIVIQDLKSGARTIVLSNASDGRYLSTGHLVYASAGVLLAAPIDLRRRALVGASKAVIEGVGRAIAGQTGATQFAAADNGTIAYLPGPATASANRLDLALMDRQGVIRALQLPLEPYEYPRASPNGAHVAFGTDDGKRAVVWIYDLSGKSARRQLTFGGNNRSPVWSGDSTRVAFQSDRDGDAAIFWQRADGTGDAERLTKPEAGTSHIPESWSPDSKTLLFLQLKGSTYSLWTLSLEDRQVRPYGRVEASGRITATFSPDGLWVAYSVYQITSTHTYVEPFPATGTKYEVPVIANPFWSPDGRELFGRPGGRFLAVNISTRPSFTFGNPVELPLGGLINRSARLGRNTDIVPPDGKQFVGVIPAERSTSGTSDPERIHVVEHWFEELKAKVK